MVRVIYCGNTKKIGREIGEYNISCKYYVISVPPEDFDIEGGQNSVNYVSDRTVLKIGESGNSEIGADTVIFEQLSASSV